MNKNAGQLKIQSLFSTSCISGAEYLYVLTSYHTELCTAEYFHHHRKFFWVAPLPEGSAL
jgi:hypothetical protein